MTMRKVWKRGKRSRRGGREEEEEDKKSGGKGERKKQKRGENEGRRAKASRGNRPLRLFSGRRKPPLLLHDSLREKKKANDAPRRIYE